MRTAMTIGAIAAAVAVAGCGRKHAEEGGPTVQRDYQVGAFDQVEVAGPYDVTIRTGAKPSVRAEGDERMIERLVVEVKGNRLEIRPRREGTFGWNWGSHSHKGTIAITVPSLTAATLAGSGGISIDKVEGDRFEGQIAGSGSLTIGSVSVGSLKLGIAGSGDARAQSGTAANAEYEIAGSGDLDAGGIRSESVKVSVAGSGDVRANATSSADVNIVGSGDVEIAGGAKCSVSKAGSGDVRCS